MNLVFSINDIVYVTQLMEVKFSNRIIYRLTVAISYYSRAVATLLKCFYLRKSLINLTTKNCFAARYLC